MKAEADDPGGKILSLFIQHLTERLENRMEEPITAAEGNVILTLLRDNSITLSSVRAGNFGTFAQKVADDFPFPDQEVEGGVN